MLQLIAKIQKYFWNTQPWIFTLLGYFFFFCCKMLMKMFAILLAISPIPFFFVFVDFFSRNAKIFLKCGFLSEPEVWIRKIIGNRYSKANLISWTIWIRIQIYVTCLSNDSHLWNNFFIRHGYIIRKFLLCIFPLLAVSIKSTITLRRDSFNFHREEFLVDIKNIIVFHNPFSFHYNNGYPTNLVQQ